MFQKGRQASIILARASQLEQRQTISTIVVVTLWFTAFCMKQRRQKTVSYRLNTRSTRNIRLFPFRLRESITGNKRRIRSAACGRHLMIALHFILAVRGPKRSTSSLSEAWKPADFIQQAAGNLPRHTHGEWKIQNLSRSRCLLFSRAPPPGKLIFHDHTRHTHTTDT